MKLLNFVGHSHRSVLDSTKVVESATHFDAKTISPVVVCSLSTCLFYFIHFTNPRIFRIGVRVIEYIYDSLKSGNNGVG